MLEVVTGLSLASAAGLNAYIPLLGMALLSRFTNLIELPTAWAWLEGNWAMGIIGALLVIEVIVDKVPALDSVNDVLQSLVRPASGGMVFTAGTASTTAAVSDPSTFVHSSAFWPFVIGVLVALIPHVLKLVARPVLNTMTAGLAAPVMSTIEDALAVVVTVLAIIIPLAALALLALAVVFGVRRITRMRSERAAKRLGSS